MSLANANRKVVRKLHICSQRPAPSIPYRPPDELVWLWPLHVLFVFRTARICTRFTVERLRTFSIYVSSIRQLLFRHLLRPEDAREPGRVVSLLSALILTNNGPVANWWRFRTTCRSIFTRRTVSLMPTTRLWIRGRKRGVWQRRKRPRLDWPREHTLARRADLCQSELRIL